MTGAAHITAGAIHTSSTLTIAPPTDDHMIGLMRSGGGDALCLHHLRGIISMMGSV